MAWRLGGVSAALMGMCGSGTVMSQCSLEETGNERPLQKYIQPTGHLTARARYQLRGAARTHWPEGRGRRKQPARRPPVSGVSLHLLPRLCAGNTLTAWSHYPLTRFGTMLKDC